MEFSHQKIQNFNTSEFSQSWSEALDSPISQRCAYIPGIQMVIKQGDVVQVQTINPM